MQYAYSIFISLFLFSCSTLEYGLMIESDIEKEGNAQEILDQLNDPELKKGKVFVFSNKQDGLWQFVRVNTYVLFLMSNTNKPSWQWRISLGFPSNL